MPAAEAHCTRPGRPGSGALSRPAAAGPLPAVAGNLLAGLLRLAVRIYQIVLGPHLGGACRFEPSCSHYALEALSLHGAGRGSWLVVRRLARCRPFGPVGPDPVPPPGERG